MGKGRKFPILISITAFLRQYLSFISFSCVPCQFHRFLCRILVMKFSVRSARAHYHRGEYGPAVANYMAVLKLAPANVSALETEFLHCFDKFVEQLESAKKTKEANEYYTLIYELYSGSLQFLTSWGQFLSRQALHEEAALCFMKSLDLQPEYADAKRSLRNLRYGLVDQWHFRMLNDRQRNEAYEEALSVCLARSHFPSPTLVLDIGCGTGILSMLAVEAGAQKVFACEQSSIMCQMAKKVLISNGFGENDEVKLIEKHSKDLNVVEDLDGQRAHLVVTELMDAGFFGEGLVGALVDAKERGLIAPDGLVIPAKAQIWACLIECEWIRRAYSTLENGCSISVQSALCTGSAASAATCRRKEPYTSVVLGKVKGGFRYLSAPVLIDEIDLNDISDLKRRVDGICSSHATTITETGMVDAIACWFRVDLLPQSISTSTSSICTKPENAESAWEQAIFPVCCPKEQLSGSTIPIEVNIRDDWMQCTASLPSSERQQSPIIIDDTMSLIELINDDRLISFYQQCLEQDCRDSESTILDLTGNPSVSSVLSNSSNVWAVFTNPSAVLIAEEFKKNTRSRIVLLPSVDEIEFTNEDASNLDILLCCPIDPCGLFKQNALEEAAFCRLHYQIPVIVPNRVEMQGVLVQSEELERYARVTSDQNTLGLKIKSVINVLETDIQRDLELSTLNRTTLSDPARLMVLNLMELCEDADTNQLPGFLSQTTRTSIRASTAGTVSALLFWFELCDADGRTRLSTADPNTHFRVSAALSTPLPVAVDDVVTVTSTLERSELYFSLDLVSLADV